MNTLAEQRSFMITHGYLNLGSVVDKTLCSGLLDKIRQRQPVSPNIFLTEAAFDENPVFKGVNPMPGRNILEDFPDELNQVESTDAVVQVLNQVLGDSYEILNKKVICGVPEQWIPDWLLTRIRENPVNNLGAYVKPELRNMTYFYGIDFHQDIIDWPGRELDFITLYVYLHDVGETDAPLQLLEDSHKLGVDSFPHKLEQDFHQQTHHSRSWKFTSAVNSDSVDCRYLTITGETGNVGLWHSCTLHGTQPNKNDTERLSLRYLIRRLPDSKGAAIDEMNEQMAKHLFDDDMRLDLDNKGKAQVKKNYLYKQQKQKVTEEP